MDIESKGVVEIFTDGSCLGNPGNGGWAALLRYGKAEKKISGGEKNTTNNRMELLAAIEALSCLERTSSVRLTTDSQYLRLGITEWIVKWKRNGWKRSGNQAVKNADLWKRLLELNEKHTVTWHWVKAHNGNVDNECVDQMALKAAKKVSKL
ncbi:MAG: ribonuclease HI [Pseudomonadota bacterium]|nr:ribonuclease HI [Pseudomonadota bacterium]